MLAAIFQTRLERGEKGVQIRQMMKKGVVKIDVWEVLKRLG